MDSLNKSLAPKNWEDFSDDELVKEISKIIKNASNEMEAKLEIKNSLGYPYDVNIAISDFESNGDKDRMYMFMAYSKNGEILEG